VLGGLTVLRRPASPVPALLVLTFVTGIVDAVSVLGLGRVFVANMTGNVAFLGFATIGTPGFHFAPLLAALLSFLLGALVAGRVLARGAILATGLSLHVAIEAFLLAAAGAIATGYDPLAMSPEARLYAIIGLTGAAMGYRNATIRHLKVPDLTTTVLTLTITGLAADSSAAGGTNPNWRRRVASVLGIGAGAASGAALFSSNGVAAPLFVGAVLVLCAAFLCPSSNVGRPSRHPPRRIPRTDRG